MSVFGHQETHLHEGDNHPQFVLILGIYPS